MERNPTSHKGENGKVAIVGGSRFMHGAPILAALAAEASGVDIITLCIPACHEEAAKASCLNCFVHPFLGNDIVTGDVRNILELLATMDSCVIGPGVARAAPQVRALMDIVAEVSCPMVLDASALQRETLGSIRGKTVVVTPHLGELERMDLRRDGVAKAAREAGVTICVKGMVDLVAGPDGKTREISGGNAGLTVGGTGDTLAGLIAGLIAQRVPPTNAAALGTGIIKKAGEKLFALKGFAYTAHDVIGILPELLR